jgi:hypothetical protein
VQHERPIQPRAQSPLARVWALVAADKLLYRRGAEGWHGL